MYDGMPFSQVQFASTARLRANARRRILPPFTTSHSRCRPGSNCIFSLPGVSRLRRFTPGYYLSSLDGTLEFRGLRPPSYSTACASGQSRLRVSVNLVVPARHNLTASHARNLVYPRAVSHLNFKHQTLNIQHPKTPPQWRYTFSFNTSNNRMAIKGNNTTVPTNIPAAR